MNGDQTSVELDKLRVDCLIGKKKHYNARDRYNRRHTQLGVAVVVITSIMGTSVFASLSEDALLGARIITGVLVVVAAVLAGLQTFFNFEKRSLNHKGTADRYLALMKKAQRLTAFCKDGTASAEDLKGELEAMSKEIEDIQRTELETSPGDYEKARKGVQEGEETYTERELSH